MIRQKQQSLWHNFCQVNNFKSYNHLNAPYRYYCISSYFLAYCPNGCGPGICTAPNYCAACGDINYVSPDCHGNSYHMLALIHLFECYHVEFYTLRVS